MPLPNLIPSPFISNPWAGLLEGQTASFYRLDPFGNPIGAVSIGGLPNPNKTSFDMIDSEQSSMGFTITDNAMQDVSDATSNNFRKMATMTLTGTLVSGFSFGLLGSIDIGSLPGFSGTLRSDLQRLQALRALAELREPIMVVTPRITFPRCMIEDLTDNWDPSLGESTTVSVLLKESRIVNSLLSTSLIPDVASMNAGSVVPSPMGSQGGTPIATQEVTQPPAFGASPGIGLGPA